MRLNDITLEMINSAQQPLTLSQINRNTYDTPNLNYYLLNLLEYVQ